MRSRQTEAPSTAFPGERSRPVEEVQFLLKRSSASCRDNLAHVPFIATSFYHFEYTPFYHFEHYSSPLRLCVLLPRFTLLTSHLPTCSNFKNTQHAVRHCATLLGYDCAFLYLGQSNYLQRPARAYPGRTIPKGIQPSSI